MSLTEQMKEGISEAIEGLFDEVAWNLLGNIPKLRNKKLLVFSAKPNLSLAHLFVQSSQNRNLNEIEESFLKGLLESAHGYIDGLKQKTNATIIDRIEGLSREAKLQGRKMSEEVISQVLSEELEKARGHMKLITEAEATKFRNIGTSVEIAKVSSSIGDHEPNVAFIPVRDGRTCIYCINNHLMSDKITPRVFKLSEVKQSFLSTAEKKAGGVSMHGQHPGDRCTLIYLAKDYGFKNGVISYVGLGHDEYSHQKSKKD